MKGIVYKLSWRTLQVAFAAQALLLLCVPYLHAQAPYTPVDWSTPVKLSSDINVLYPTIVADPHGGVHVFWVQGEDPGGPTDAIVSVDWDGSAWTTPNDILVAPRGSGMVYDMPRATVDKNGQIYLVWTAAGSVYFSSAQATMSSSAQAWAPPTEAVQVTLAHLPQVAVDERAVIHIVVADRKQGGGVVYAHSADGGGTWTDPLIVSIPNSTTVPDNPQLIVSSKDTLHVFWSENYPPEFLGREVYHVRSSDGGTSWSLPTRLSFSDNQEDWDAVPVAAVDKDDHLHLLWVCENANRCYRTSQDGGVTWNDADRLYSPLLGSAGWDAMAADPFGSVYWVGALRYPMALYATSYDGARWHEPPVPAISGSESDGLSEAHRPQMAVGLGNKLHVTMVERDAGPVYYMLGTTANTATTALPLPTPTLGTVKAANDSSMAGTAEISGTYLGATAKQALQVIDNPIIAERTSYSTEVAPRVPFDSTLVTIVTVVITVVAASAAAAKHRR